MGFCIARIRRKYDVTLRCDVTEDSMNSLRCDVTEVSMTSLSGVMSEESMTSLSDVMSLKCMKSLTCDVTKESTQSRSRCDVIEARSPLPPSPNAAPTWPPSHL